MNGATAEEKITEWNEGESLKIEVTELKKMPGIATMEATFSIRSENGKTILKAILEYGMKNNFFDILNIIMVKRMNTTLWNSVLAGHKRYIETGEKVNQKTSLDLDQVVVLN